MTDGYASYQNAIVETVFKILKVVYFRWLALNYWTIFDIKF
ncbi:hypothetical protein [Spiroplasma endosymbiont of Villa modesta]